MSLTVFCMVAMLLSVSTVIFAIILGAKTYRSEFVGKGDAVYKKHFVLTPFQIFLLCFFIGSVFIFIPIYYTDYFAGEAQFARILKSIFLSIHNTMRLFILDGDFDIIENAVTDPARVNYVVGYVYSIYSALLFVVAPIMTASFVLSFFKNASSYFKYTFNLSTKIYYISELNEKSIALATNILAESGIRKPLIVFFDVFEDKDEISSELLEKSKRLGAICFQKDITEINLKHLFSRAERKFYFIGENEDENIKQALTLIKYCRESKYYNNKQSEEVEYILDILYDYYEEQGFFDEDSDDEVDIDEDEILQYVVDQVEKDKKAGEKLAQKFDEDRIADVLEGEYGYCDKTGVFTDNEDEE